MRVALFILLAAVLLAPLTASAQSRGECGWLTRQIEHYKGMELRAVSFENEMWEERLDRHVEYLEERRVDRCPEYESAADKTKEQMAALLKLAAKAAVTYFTFGAF